ncbi:hypothetical protein H8M03_02195 [Sphingomonas sabuli]|uniref:Uncharacterized protein n=1 Tax=Sphingomonas sabuli TaxID=2764186 RepID=A0A7G9L3I9_9SPHN|nr:hypothetical protein [Sphingomonas sabuli]QNM83188.1 hypothetical protein H8M03_02195 [Sphingomonas sabuli]
MKRTGGLRAEWLAQITDKIDLAQRLAWELRAHADVSAEARDLYDRLEAARLELDAIRAADRWREASNDDWWFTQLDQPRAPFDRAD